MKKTALILGTTTLVLGGLFATVNSASAYRGDPSIKGPDCTEERHQEMEQAFESNDYQAWRDLMEGKGRVTQVVNEDNFAQFVEAHELAEEGKMDEAREIRQELGLGLRDGAGNGGEKGSGQGQRGGR